MSSTRADRALIALCVTLAAAAALRLLSLNIPFVEPYNSLSRQSLSASVARNFFERGFVFMNPEINENGRGPYLFNAEMPVYNYLMAIGYKLAGGVREWVARSVSVLFSLATIVSIALFVRRRIGTAQAVAAAAFLAASPLYLALSRSVQPESAMIFFATAALLLYYRYEEGGGVQLWWASVAFAFLAVATKFYNAYLFLPVAWLAWRSRGTRVFRDPRLWSYFALASLALLWYAHMMQMGRTYRLAYIVYEMDKTRGPENMSYLEALFSPTLLGSAGKIFLFHLLTPLAAPFFLKGLFTKPETKLDHFMRVWLAAVVFTLVFFWKTVTDHPYYQLPLVLPCAFYVARGFTGFRVFRWVRGAAAAALWGALVLGQVAVFARLYPGIYRIPEVQRRIVEGGRRVELATPPGSLVVASYGGSPIQLYYCHRKGWAFDMRSPRADDELIRDIERMRSEGAQFFMTTTLDALRAAAGFNRHLRERYPVLADEEAFFLVDLRVKN